MERLSSEVINTLYPVSGVEIYKGALRIRRICTVEMLPSQKKKEGQIVTKLSRRSLSNFAFVVSSTSVEFHSLLTLSYGVNWPKDGRVVKQNLTRFLTWLKRHHKGVEYFWFLEFQRRGAPHLHLGLTIGYPGKIAHYQMAMQWARISNPYEGVYCDIPPIEFREPGFVCPGDNSVLGSVAAQHRRKQVWEDIRSPGGAIRYVLSYACKPHQKTVPRRYSNVGRFWGCSYGVKPGSGASFSASEDEVRELARVLGRNVEGFDVLPKILFHSGNLPENFVPGTMFFDQIAS